MKKNKGQESQIIQWKDKDGQEKFLASYNSSMEEALNEVQPIVRSISSNIYENVYSPSISVRDEFDRNDYEYYRPGEGIPTDDKGKIKACLEAYNKSGYGIVKNIVDLMSDFATQGIDVSYEDKKKEKLIRSWFHDIVKGPERSKRFANLACKSSNIIVNRKTAKVPLKVIRQYYKSKASPDVAYKEDEVTVEKRELPISYCFLNPMSIDILSPELSMFVDSQDKRLGLRASSDLIARVQYPKTDIDKELIEQIPAYIINYIRKNGGGPIPLEKDKVSIYFYNKDDWQTWATPMIYSVLSDLKHLEKLKLADLSALDGAISQIRIWKIGDIEKGIKPSAAAVAKLSQILMNSVSGGFLDLVWSQDLQFEEVTSAVHNFLGEEKYTPVLNAIYTGLGIPPLFTGSSNQGSFTNNFIAIKTLIERLESIRNLLREFWNKEFEIVQKALSLDKPILLSFDRMTLNDESSFLQIMLHLADRGYVSIETMQEMVGTNPEIEDFRIKREWKEQTNKERPAKASQWHNPEWEQTWLDSFIKLGEITPSQVGLELEEKASGEIPPAVRKEKMAKETAKLKKSGSDLGGRPRAAKDKKKRKQKEVKPRRSVSNLMNLIAWSTETQNKISEVITPKYLKSLSKKNLRQLNDQEFAKLERDKFAILASISPYQTYSNEVIEEYWKTNNDVPETMDMMLKEMIGQYSKHNDITVDKTRELQAIVYAAYNLQDNNDE